MLKRIWALLLCAVVLFAALPFSASAASDDEKQRICDQIRSIYWKTYSSAGGDLKGYCGVMAGWELYYLGVTDVPITQNGNEMYNILSRSEHINEGFRPELYPATSYTIEEALNTITACGTKDAYNIMAGYHWTTTDAGSLYGHVTVIHAVLDGMVYFTEGFITPFQVNPSQPMICSIADFADYYDSWTGFEGMIHFGRDNYVNGCEMFGCNQFVSADAPVSLLSLPNFTEAEKLRVVQVGERLRAVALCKDAEGVLYYQIMDEDTVCYLPAALVKPVWYEYNDLTVEGVTLPTHVDQGKDFSLTGTIRSKYNKIYNLVVQITDADNEVVLSYEINKNGNMVDLNTRIINARVDISMLPEGNYTYHLYCDMLNHCDYNNTVIGNIERVSVASSDFTVGNAPEQKQVKTVSAPQVEEKTGWQYENGSWYYYENNVPRTGWFCDQGIDYYLQEDGAAATGWQMINGQNRYFSDTGAMRTGWVKNAGGRYYMLSNGAPSKGMKEIDGVQYYFSEIGRLVTDTVVVYNGQAYQLDENGVTNVK